MDSFNSAREVHRSHEPDNTMLRRTVVGGTWDTLDRGYVRMSGLLPRRHAPHYLWNLSGRLTLGAQLGRVEEL